MPAKSAREFAKTHHESSWKSTQSKRGVAKKTKLALFVLGLILLLLLLFQIIRLTQTFFNPWQTSHERKYRWNRDFNISLVIRSKSISFISFNPKEEKITLIDIPPSTYMEVPGGFGMWQIRSIYDLGETQKDIGGGRLLKESLTQFLALPVDGFLLFLDQFSQKEPIEVISMLRESPFTLIGILPNLKTDLTLFELIRLKMGLSSVRFDKISEIDLANSNSLGKERLADGTDVFIVDPIKLDPLLSDLVDPIIQSEHKTIAIFNATDHPNLAQKAARLISNIGGDVIIISNSEKRLAKTQILGEQSKTKERLKQIFIENGKIEPNLEGLASSRAQIDLFLGEDYFNSL